MRYQTGDVAEFMGMTNMGVIYLEKRGIVSSTREGNGYRSFGLEDITRLGLLRSYEKLGFTLEQALALTEAPKAALLQALEERQRTLEEQMAMLRYVREGLREGGEGPLNGGTAHIETMPELYYCPVWEDQYDMEALPPETQRLLRRIDVSWISAMPYMRYCSKLTRTGVGWYEQRGNCIRADHARALGVLLDPQWVETVPAQTCLRYYAEGIDMEEALRRGETYLTAQGLEPAKTVYVPLTLRYAGRKVAHRRMEVYMPIQEIER